jgi:RNA polymerase primary sigma factor
MRQLKITQNITNRENQSLEKYFQDVNKIEMISSEEEVVLAQRIQDGDAAALEKLVKSNLRFVVSVAKQYQNKSLTLNDLINEGNLGLIKAAQKFDHTRGFKFISYAVWWIRQSIMQALAEHSRLVRIPLNKVGSLNKINKAMAELEQKYNRAPTDEELAEILEMDDKELKGTLSARTRHVSVDAPFAEGESNSLLDVLEDGTVGSTDGDLEYTSSLQIETERSLATLDPREQQVLRMYFGIGEQTAISLEQIAETLNITRERVRQIKEKAIKKLQHDSRNRLLIDYLG